MRVNRCLLSAGIAATSLVDDLEPRFRLSAAHGPAHLDVPPVPIGPDLVVRFVNRPRRGTIVGGTRGRALISVTNRRHTAPALPTTVGLYLSSDAALDAGDHAVGTWPVGARLNGRSVMKSLKFTFPADLPSGPYHLLAHVDDADANAEVNETNNLADGGTIAYAAPFADIVPLALKNVKLYYFHGSGISGGATLWLRNVGNADFTGTITGTIYISPSYISGIGGPYTKQLSVKRGARAKIGLPLNAPSTPGGYVFTITADAPADPTPGQGASAVAQVVNR
jgi:hypothetical protein